MVKPAKLIWRSLVRGVFKAVGLDSTYGANDYGATWPKQREKCLEFDNHTCRVCKTSASELDGALVVHHITPPSEYDGTPLKMNGLGNLVTLCPSCHDALDGKYQNTTRADFVERARDDTVSTE